MPASRRESGGGRGGRGGVSIEGCGIRIGLRRVAEGRVAERWVAERRVAERRVAGAALAVLRCW